MPGQNAAGSTSTSDRHNYEQVKCATTALTALPSTPDFATPSVNNVTQFRCRRLHASIRGKRSAAQDPWCWLDASNRLRKSHPTGLVLALADIRKDVTEGRPLSLP